MEKNEAGERVIKKKVLYFLLALPAIWILLTVVVPLAMGDGLGNYSGEQREIAEAVLNSSNRSLDNKSRWSYILHVKDVHEATNEEQKLGCPIGKVLGNFAYSSRYTVVLETRQFGALIPSLETHVGCAGWNQ